MEKAKYIDKIPKFNSADRAEKTISSIDNQINIINKKLDELLKQKAIVQTEHAIKSFKEGCYYVLHDGWSCKSYYIKYTKENFSVQDMTGTVGYEGENKVLIGHGLKVYATRATYQAGIFHNLYLKLSDFKSFNIEEISEEAYKNEAMDIISSIKSKLSEDIPDSTSE